jgi:uncharacterized protein Yka (UPF0111/DUF47 family)
VEGVTKHAVLDPDQRWIVEAIIELCLTIEDSAELIEQAVNRVGDHLQDVHKNIKQVEAAIDAIDIGKKP